MWLCIGLSQNYQVLWLLGQLELGVRVVVGVGFIVRGLCLNCGYD